MNNQNDSKEIFTSGYNCCQTVLVKYCEEHGLDAHSALKIASCFGGGMAKGHICGVVTGALMVLGLNHGYVSNEAQEQKQIAKTYAKDLQDAFIKEFGTLHCKELLGCDTSTPEGKDEALKLGLFETKCPRYIEFTIEYLEEVLDS
ncbi:C-GCAxxG-C-C family protein [Vallitalea okinawensis]|uniref:C-GCAxxG-C-C family protein n=1 Tax=Vallitalea okinawensis TaxID=2078660 RepID=UPI0013004190|nr:C-GCAxxG-C-C family protein [Vallitalea okinawensis]